jgi:adenine-specific DNA-methyltransferase
LTAELEGRSFGGGVLELVPSEIARLSVPMTPDFEGHFAQLDGAARNGGAGDALVELTNELIVAADIGFSASLLDIVEDARRTLMQRRLARAETDTHAEPRLDLVAV